jgi:hypothetical protein
MKNHLLKSIIFVLSLAAEFFLVILIFITLIIGLVGVFLPVIPGLFFVGLGVAIYFFLLNSNFGHVTKRTHPQLVRIRDIFLTLKITKNSMGVIKKMKKKKAEEVKGEILKHGLILCGFNLILIMALLLGSVTISVGSALVSLDGLSLVFGPLLLIFAFAAGSAIVWYRFGQILGQVFKDNKVVNAGLVVMLSILPLLILLITLSSLANASAFFQTPFIMVAILGIILMSVLAAVFELVIVILGALTKV